MKVFRLLLVLSVAANLALLALRLFAPASDETVRAAHAQNYPPAAARIAGAPRSTAQATNAAGAAKANGGSDWSDLRSDDLEEVLTRLRAAGFPEKTVRAIVETLANERFAAHEQQVFYGDVDPKDFWKQGSTGGISLDSAAKQRAYTEYWRERNDFMKKLLGPDYQVQDETSLAYARRQYGNLSAEKIAQIQDTLEHFNDLRLQITPTGRMPLPDEAPQLADLQRQSHAELAKLLTPDELQQYDLRTSNTANDLRYKLQSFGASEAEYRSIYAIYQPWVEQYNGPGNPTPEQQQARAAAEKQLQPAIEGALGPDRYADFQQATNPQYQQLNAIVARLDLPLSAARDVAGVQQDIQQRAAAIRRDPMLAADQRNAQLSALATEAQTKISTTLGPNGLAAYQQYGGQWLQNLVPRAPKK